MRFWSSVSATIYLLLISILAACGGGGGSTQTSPSGPQSFNKQYFYVDPSGICSTRTPCHTSLYDALRASFLSQFDSQLQLLRPGAPTDEIVVMPGIYISAAPSDTVFGAGINQENNPSGQWKIDIIAEEGPNQTFITGLGIGPCIEITDNIQLRISGFTIADCYEYQSNIVNEDFSIYIQSYSNVDLLIDGNVFDSNGSESAVIGISPCFVNVTNLNIRITRNTFKNNQGSIYLQRYPIDANPNYSSDILIDNNIVYNNQAGIWIGNFTNAFNNISVDIVYNTIINNSNTGLAIQQTNGINAKNNIVHGNGIDIRGSESGHNYWDRYGVPFKRNYITNNLVGEVSNLSAASNIVDDPLLVSAPSEDFTPRLDSPVIDSGATLSSYVIETDFLSNQRVRDGDADMISIPDIGAIEIQ